mmetsp:Transcript_39339/g.90907  ORF Transcript_39339/g.90907 Transcript_39339/m.90907 type:complete len:700 (+) Transcript_39339:77-2176(+)
MAASAVEIAHGLLDKLKDDSKMNRDETWKEIFGELRKTPAAVERPPLRKMSLLHWASYTGHHPAVKTLLEEFGANPADLSWKKMDAAGTAEVKKHFDIAETIRDHMLAKDLHNKAAQEGGQDSVWSTIFEELRKRPAAKDRPKQHQFSLLHHAAWWGKKEAIGRLANDHGADLKERAADGRDAASIAENQRHQDVADMLRLMIKGVRYEAAAFLEVPSPYAPKLTVEAGRGDVMEAGAVVVWLALHSSAEPPKWEPYTAQQNARMAQAVASKAQEVKLTGKSINLGERLETDTASGRKRQLRSCRIVWEWDAGAGAPAAPDWRPYEADVQLQLEAAIGKGIGHDACCKIDIGGRNYVVDLVGFRQHLVGDSYRCRRVKRRGVALRVPLAPHVRDLGSGTLLDLSQRPKYWNAALAGADPTKAQRADLPLASPIAQQIISWMNNTIRKGHASYGLVAGAGKKATLGMQVVRIEMVQHPRLWRRYCCHSSKMKLRKDKIASHRGTGYLKDNPAAIPSCTWLDKDINEAYLWHGTGWTEDGKLDILESIVDVGAAPSSPPCDHSDDAMEVEGGTTTRTSKKTSMFGVGVYLADLSSKANLYVPCPNCRRGSYFRKSCGCSPGDVKEPYRMLLCRAALGQVYIEGDYDEKRYKGDFNPANKLGVDSVMGEALAPLAFREYILYDDSACYPEFIVHYWRKDAPI